MDIIKRTGLLILIAFAWMTASAQVTPSIRQSTSTQVLVNFHAATHGGLLINTSDMGLLTSDGVRWLTGAAPPIPPGAAILGYTHNTYTLFPAFADIAFTNVLSRLYNGTFLVHPNPPSGAYTTATNGQLQISYPNGGPSTNASALTTQRNVNSQPVQGNLGYFPYLLGSNGFCAEIAVTLSGNNTDNFFAFFLEPQEHNTTQNDHLPTDPAGYERWLELDVNENGHGTDFSGAFRGAALSWEGFGVNGGITFTVAPTGTSGTLTAPWGGSTRSDWTIKFSDAQTHTATLTNGSTAATWVGAITGSPLATGSTVPYVRSFISNVQVAALDYTSEHIFTGCMDPVGQTWAIWQDGVLQNTLAIPAANAIVYTWHYFPLVVMQSHGSNVGFTGTVRYIAAWTP